LLHVYVGKDGFVEHTIAMIVAAKLYFKVVCSQFVEIYRHNLARIEMAVVVGRPQSVRDDQPEAH
jgi:hypothetical protein